MVGGGKRKDDGSLVINSTNVFAALDSLRRKKKSDKESSKSKGSLLKTPVKEAQPQVFWAPSPLSGKSWADVDDDDDEDYYATTAPPQAVWTPGDHADTKGTSTPIEESESEEDGLDVGDDEIDIEEEPEHEPEVPVPAEPILKKPSATIIHKEAERQLSKKELKKKELAELEAVLAELGIPKNNEQEEAHASVQGKKSEPNGDVEKKENAPVLTESKSAKKKKKKDKSSKEIKDAQDELNESENTAIDEATGRLAVEETTVIDVKERLKKVTSMKKKKSSKEMDAAARSAAIEAAARSAKLAAAKKKEKNHYNQQPVR